MGAVGSYMSGQAEADAANQSATRNYEHQIKLREADWTRQLAIYNNKTTDYKNAVGANASAADRAYASEQYRLNEQFQQAAFQKQNMLAQLVQAQGSAANTGISGKSAGKMQQATLAAFGRNNAILAENLASARTAMINRNEDTRLQLQGANNRAWSQVAIGPTPGIAPMAPTMQSGPSTGSLLLGLGSAALSGLGTYANLKAPSAGGGGGDTFGGYQGGKPLDISGSFTDTVVKSPYKFPSGNGFNTSFNWNL